MTRLLSKTPVSYLLVAVIFAALNNVTQGQTVKTPPPKTAQLKKGPDPLLQAALANFKANKTAFLNSEGNSLRTAGAFLALANANYHGHKVKAAAHIQKGLSLLDSEAMANGSPQQKSAMQVMNKAVIAQAQSTGKFFSLVYQDQQASSDAQLRGAAVLLLQLEPILAVNQQSAVFTQVEIAGQQILAALNTTRELVKFNEAEVLREAKILLVIANRDYDGHRAKAVHHLQLAINALDKSIMKYGTTLMKIVTLAEDDVTVQAKVLAKYLPPVHENQVQSDLQLMAAAGLLLQVELSMSLYNQMHVMENIDRAGQEIVIALKIR